MLKAKNPVLLSDDTLAKAFANPFGPMNELSKFVFYSRYSRYRDDVRRREYWAETCQRSTEYNVNLAIAYLEQQGKLTPELREFHQRELEKLFDNQFNLRQFLAGRTLWIGGTDVSYEYPMANFNCAFVVIDHWHKIGELVYLGMIGAGVGFRILRRDVEKLDPITRLNVELEHKPYRAKPAPERIDESKLEVDGDTAILIVGDSKEGWAQAANLFFDFVTGKAFPGQQFKKLVIDYDNIRPGGERIKRFGGRAGGPKLVQRAYDKIWRVLHGTLTKDYPALQDGKVQPIHVLDICNIMGQSIVSGGVREVAQIALLDPTDKHSIEAKRNIFDKPELDHRYLSNNSVFYESRPSDEQLDWQFDVLRYEGEPCFVNAEAARRRRADFQGVNPCGEILLDDRGMCNLTTVNVMSFVKDGKLDLDGLLEAQRMSARAGLRMTLPTMELPEWDRIQQRDRLVGTSLTGWYDAMDAIGADEEKEQELLRLLHDTARQAVEEYAEMLGVNKPLLVTTVKPEGTISQLAGGVSSGMHRSHAPAFIRRIGVKTMDPLARTVFEIGWRMHADFYDGSAMRCVTNITQYFDYIEQDKVKWQQWQYYNGVLTVRFLIEPKKGVQSSAVIADIAVKLQTMYDGNSGGKLGRLAVTYIDDGKLEVEYTVLNPTWDEAFGQATKVVVDFPVVTTARRTKFNVTAVEQLESYRRFITHYVEHNASNTISVRPNEWDEVKQWIKDHWDDVVAVTFLPLDDNPYPLSPFEACSKEEAERLAQSMKAFDPTILNRYDSGDDLDIDAAGCENGACPVR